MNNVLNRGDDNEIDCIMGDLPDAGTHDDAIPDCGGRCERQ